MARRLSRISLAARVSTSSLFVLSFFVRVVVVLAYFLIAACVRAFNSLFIICELSLAPYACLSFIRFVMVSAASRCSRNRNAGKRCNNSHRRDRPMRPATAPMHTLFAARGFIE